MAKSGSSVTRRQNVNFKELSWLVAMAQPEPVMRAKHSILTNSGDGEACHEKSRGRRNESNRRFPRCEIGVVPTFATAAGCGPPAHQPPSRTLGATQNRCCGQGGGPATSDVADFPRRSGCGIRCAWEYVIQQTTVCCGASTARVDYCSSSTLTSQVLPETLPRRL